MDNTNDFTPKLEALFSRQFQTLTDKFQNDLDDLEKMKYEFTDMYHDCEYLANPPAEITPVEVVETPGQKKAFDKPADSSRSKTPIRINPAVKKTEDANAAGGAGVAGSKKDIKEMPKSDARSKTPIVVKKDQGQKAGAANTKANDAQKSTNNLTKVDVKQADPKDKKIEVKKTTKVERDLTPTPGNKKRSMLDTSQDIAVSNRVKNTKNEPKATTVFNNENDLKKAGDSKKGSIVGKRGSTTPLNGNVDNKARKSGIDKKLGIEEAIKNIPGKSDENDNTDRKEEEDDNNDKEKNEELEISKSIESARKITNFYKLDRKIFSNNKVECMYLLTKSRYER